MADVNVTLYTTPYGVPGPAGSTAELASKLVGQTFAGLQQFTEGISCGVFSYNGWTYSAFMADAINFNTSTVLDFNEQYNSLCFGSTYYSNIINNENSQNALLLGYNNMKSSLLGGGWNTSTIVGNNNFSGFPGYEPIYNTQNSVSVLGTNNFLLNPRLSQIVCIGNNTGTISTENLANQGFDRSIFIGDECMKGSTLSGTIDSVFIGTRIGSYSACTITQASNSVIIGADALYRAQGNSYVNNVIIGYQAGYVDTQNLQNSVIIGPVFGANFAAISTNYTAKAEPSLGNTQLKIGSGRTAWISGSCLGYVGIGGVTYPEGNLHVKNSFVLNPVTAPTTGTSPGVTGSIAWDNNYIYVCAAGNSWRRAPLSPF